MTEWISVKDSLPKEGDIILAWGTAFYSEPHPVVTKYSYVRYFKKQFGTCPHCRGLECDNEVLDVSHWMPLPESPKGSP